VIALAEALSIYLELREGGGEGGGEGWYVK